jgi:hypothetical protein
MKIPSPQQRPDLYDDFDYDDRPAGWKNPVQLPAEIQKLIDARQAKQPAPAKEAEKV